MRHRRRSEKFSRSRAQRKALVRSLLRAIIIYESIKTTESKAKGLRPWVDKLIEWGKDNTLHSRRLAYRLLNDHKLVKKLFDDIAPRFTNTNGGYTRIIDLNVRKGDAAKITLLEFTQTKKRLPSKKGKQKKETTPESTAGVPPSGKEEDSRKGFMQGVKRLFKK
jgi:large subunit ribosomal protein L17